MLKSSFLIGNGIINVNNILKFPVLSNPSILKDLEHDRRTDKPKSTILDSAKKKKNRCVVNKYSKMLNHLMVH